MEKVLVGIGILIGILILSVAAGLLIGRIPLNGEEEPRVSIIPVHGLLMRDAEIPAFDVDECITLLEETDKDDSVGAIVLDIDSGGGLVVPSEMLARAVKSVNKPIVAWIGGTGASGSYWVASSADYVISDPLSLTGSIGVTTDVIIAEDLMKKVGIRMESFTSGEFKSMGTFERNMTKEEKALMQALVDELHTEFVAAIAENRNMTVEDVSAIADGRVFLGKDALELGLVDEVGGRESAVRIAAGMANMTSYNTEVVKKEKGFMEMLRELTSVSAKNIGLGIAEGAYRFDTTTRA